MGHFDSRKAGEEAKNIDVGRDDLVVLELSKEKIIASALLLPDLIAEIYRKGEEALGLVQGRRSGGLFPGKRS